MTTEDKKTIISIDDEDYVYEDLTTQQQTLVKHVADLTAKMETAQYQLDQATMAHTGFIKLLKQSLSEE